MPAINCTGVLADPADPQASVLYTKVAGPTCGAPMPIGGEALDDDDLTCLQSWISGLLPPGEECMDCLCDPGVDEDCYAGLEGTADVGICRTGTQTCQTDGMGWTACEGEVRPRGEDCSTPDIDEDCDGATPECSEVWAIGFGDGEDQAMRSVALDSAGNVYGFADFQGVVSFGGDPLTATPSTPPKTDLAITKHDRFGNPLWSLRFGDSSTQHAVKVLVDADGNLVFLGRFFGNIDFGAGPLHSAGGNDILVFKLDSEGNHLWSRNFGDPDADRGERMVLDSQGNVILTGSFTSTAEFGNTMFTTNGMRDAFVLKLAGDTGEPLFARRVGGSGDDYGYGVDVDANDDIVIAGRFAETVELANQTLTSAGAWDIYLAKLDGTGAPLWSRSFGGVDEDEVHDLRVQSSGAIVLLGGMSQTVDFGGDDLVSAGLRDIFVTTLDPDGNHVWSARYGDASDQFEPDYIDSWLTLALDSSGNIHVGGALHGTLDFGDQGGELIANGTDNPDAMHFMLAADGSYIGGRRFGRTGTDDVFDLAVAASGHVVLAGRSTGSAIDFEAAGEIQNFAGSDGFLAKLAPL